MLISYIHYTHGKTAFSPNLCLKPCQVMTYLRSGVKCTESPTSKNFTLKWDFLFVSLQNINVSWSDMVLTKALDCSCFVECILADTILLLSHSSVDGVDIIAFEQNQKQFHKVIQKSFSPGVGMVKRWWTYWRHHLAGARHKMCIYPRAITECARDI